jgi:hypothetical protein
LDDENKSKMSSANKKRRGHAKRPHSSIDESSPPSQPSVQLVDQPNDTITPASQYLQALGPLRMSFVDDFAAPTAHAFCSQKAPPKMSQTKELFQEFLEYQLNLPVAQSSSILVRAQESRLDLARALIIGTSSAFSSWLPFLHVPHICVDPHG